MTPQTARLVLSAHVLRSLFLAQKEGHLVNLDDVVDDLQMPRAEVRSCISELHLDGLVDALHMRLTEAGFLFGIKLAKARLVDLPRHHDDRVAA